MENSSVGRLHSAIQQRPEGPAWDDDHRAFNLVRELTEASFGDEMFEFEKNGRFGPGATRQP